MKAQHDLVALSARLKSRPDTFCSLNGILQEALLIGIPRILTIFNPDETGW
jgi:hypothetical protein